MFRHLSLKLLTRICSQLAIHAKWTSKSDWYNAHIRQDMSTKTCVLFVPNASLLQNMMYLKDIMYHESRKGSKVAWEPQCYNVLYHFNSRFRQITVQCACGLLACFFSLQRVVFFMACWFDPLDPVIFWLFSFSISVLFWSLRRNTVSGYKLEQQKSSHLVKVSG